ncbi:hypothetical protein Tco_0414692 [Tanacetum coccineum]
MSMVRWPIAVATVAKCAASFSVELGLTIKTSNWDPGDGLCSTIMTVYFTIFNTWLEADGSLAPRCLQIRIRLTDEEGVDRIASIAELEREDMKDVRVRSYGARAVVAQNTFIITRQMPLGVLLGYMMMTRQNLHCCHTVAKERGCYAKLDSVPSEPFQRSLRQVDCRCEDQMSSAEHSVCFMSLLKGKENIKIQGTVSDGSAIGSVLLCVLYIPAPNQVDRKGRCRRETSVKKNHVPRGWRDGCRRFGGDWSGFGGDFGAEGEGERGETGNGRDEFAKQFRFAERAGAWEHTQPSAGDKFGTNGVRGANYGNGGTGVRVAAGSAGVRGARGENLGGFGGVGRGKGEGRGSLAGTQQKLHDTSTTTPEHIGRRHLRALYSI